MVGNSKSHFARAGTAEYAMSKSPFDLSLISLNLIDLNHPFLLRDQQLLPH